MENIIKYCIPSFKAAFEEGNIEVLELNADVEPNKIYRTDSQLTSDKYAKDKFAVRLYLNDETSLGRITTINNSLVIYHCPKQRTDAQIMRGLLDIDYLSRHDTIRYVRHMFPLLHFKRQRESLVRSRHSEAVVTIDRAKRSYISALEHEQELKNELEISEKNSEALIEDMFNFGFEVYDSNILKCTIEDITATDVQGQGVPIFLGNITYTINLADKVVNILSGTEKRHAFFEHAYHPHHLRTNSLCIGTLNAEMTEAITTLNIPIIKILLKNFSESYNSRDTAGKYYTRWLAPAVEMVYSERLGINLVKSESLISNQGVWIPKSDAFRCVNLEGYTYRNDAINIKGSWYATVGEDLGIKRINGVWYLDSDTVYSPIEGRWLVPSDQPKEYKSKGWVSLSKFNELTALDAQKKKASLEKRRRTLAAKKAAAAAKREAETLTALMQQEVTEMESTTEVAHQEDSVSLTDL
jgi:hypothetical protein